MFYIEYMNVIKKKLYLCKKTNIEVMKIKSGEYEVLKSGIIINFEDNPITFHFNDQVKAVIRFETNNVDKAVQMSTDVKNIHELIVRLINFKGSKGVGNSKPMKLGFLGKPSRNLYFNFVVDYLAANGQQVLHYTWYLGEEINHG